MVSSQMLRRSLVGFVCVLAVAPATAAPRSVSMLDGGATVEPTLIATSRDGRRVWFTSTARLTADDTDGASDIYERLGNGTISLVSLGTSAEAKFVGASDDGSRVFMTSDERLTADDTDALKDIYERTPAGTLRLVTPGTTNSFFGGNSADGTRVWFFTSQALLPSDTDPQNDVYEMSSDGVLRLISDGFGTAPAVFAGGAFDGSRVWWTTTDAGVPADTDGVVDVYERTLATEAIRSISGSIQVATPGAVTFLGGSPDHVLFATTDALARNDTDGGIVDFYDRRSDGSVKSITTSSIAAPVPAVPTFLGMSRDGAHVFYSTTEPQRATDLDTVADIYDRTGAGSLRGLTVGNEAIESTFLGASLDGNFAWWSTVEGQKTTDKDGLIDIYGRGGDNVLRFVTDKTAQPMTFAVGSGDGTRVWFNTSEVLLPEDTDGQPDSYERSLDGALSLATPGTSGAAAVIAASPEGARVFIRTTDALVPQDTDGISDIYEIAIAPPTVANATMTGVARVKQTLTCAGTVEGEFVQTAYVWTRDGVAIAGAAAATYVVTTEDAGHAVGCKVSVSNAVGSAEAASVARVVAPVVTKAKLAGVPLIGTRLTCSGAALGATARRFSWQRDGKLIIGRRAKKYRLVSRDAGHRIRCRVVATNAGGVSRLASKALLVPRLCVVPRLSGLTVAAARTRLAKAGCRVRSVERFAISGTRSGRVNRSVPAAGSRIPNGAGVALIVAR